MKVRNRRRETVARSMIFAAQLARQVLCREPPDGFLVIFADVMLSFCMPRKVENTDSYGSTEKNASISAQNKDQRCAQARCSGREKQWDWPRKLWQYKECGWNWHAVLPIMKYRYRDSACGKYWWLMPAIIRIYTWIPSTEQDQCCNSFAYDSVQQAMIATEKWLNSSRKPWWNSGSYGGFIACRIFFCRFCHTPADELSMNIELYSHIWKRFPSRIRRPDLMGWPVSITSSVRQTAHNVCQILFFLKLVNSLKNSYWPLSSAEYIFINLFYSSAA